MMRGRRKNPGIGEVVHFERPLAFAGGRIERDDSAVRCGVGPVVDRAATDIRRDRRVGRGPGGAVIPAPVVLPLLVLSRLARKDAGDVFPGRNVEESRAWTVRRRVPAGAALLPRPRCCAWWLGCLNRAALRIESARPVHLDERLAKQKLA